MSEIPAKYIWLKGWKGSYAAILVHNPLTNDIGLGADPKWCERKYFKKGATKADVARYRFTVYEPGWYESREGWRTYKGQETPKRYWRVTRTTITEVTRDHVAQAIDGPKPGEPGEWYGETCECGTEVEGYDQDGWPYCNDHHPERFQLPAWQRMSRDERPVPA